MMARPISKKISCFAKEEVGSKGENERLKAQHGELMRYQARMAC